MRHIISVLLENEPGALSRVVGLFSARGYNIETLTVAPTEDASLSRMTIVSVGSDDIIEQITKHLNRLIEVVKVVDLTEGDYIERELMLIKVRAVGKEREEMKRMADIFRGRIIDVTERELAVEHVKGAVNIPLPELRARLGELPRDREILIICRSAQRAYYTTRILLQNGFKARNLSGGMLSRFDARSQVKQMYSIRQGGEIRRISGVMSNIGFIRVAGPGLQTNRHHRPSAYRQQNLDELR